MALAWSRFRWCFPPTTPQDYARFVVRVIDYHGGDNEGFHCFAVTSVAGGSGLVVMTNGESGPKFLHNVIMDPEIQAFLAIQPAG